MLRTPHASLGRGLLRPPRVQGSDHEWAGDAPGGETGLLTALGLGRYELRRLMMGRPGQFCACSVRRRRPSGRCSRCRDLLRR